MFAESLARLALGKESGPVNSAFSLPRATLALGKESFADRVFAETALPRAALGKAFAEGLRGFAESLEPSAKPPAPVVMRIVLVKLSQL
jgi:hypothetical protein